MVNQEHAHAPKDQVKTWSPYQERIFDFVKNGSGNAIVNAVAGSGKTTTIVEALKSARGQTIFLAFNKAIAEELKKRGVNARTFHSLTYTPVTRSRNVKEVTVDKTRQIAKEVMEEAAYRTYGTFVCRLVGLAKQSGFGALVEATSEAFIEIVQHHDLELEDGDLWMAVHLAKKVLEASNKSRMVDFDDLLYLAVLDNIPLQKYDFVFVDEAQDTNAIQRELLKKIMRPTSRMVAVGDPAQAIYGFRGASSDSLALIRRQFGAVELPLTVTYRCARNIVEYARQWVNHIQAADNAPEGDVYSFENYTLEHFQSEDLVVCRTTKPLIKLGYQFLRAKKPFYIMGKEIGQGLKSVINKMKASTLPELLKKLENWRHNEIMKAGEDEAKVAAISDKYSSIVCMADEESTIDGLLVSIDKMFSEKKDAVILATIHKSKGLEAEKVWWLNSSQCPAKWARLDWQQEQERNLCYVAATRAKNELCLIEEREV